ncbi:squalene-hopene cyclase [Pseudonocardia dioxanivorans CB1190]|uniref:Squalene-hopene cyclase n=1 Tax=Pseudonocardia dioxanivorans (strain ATCC 55486 / DSM 44775 / JCM 13855 / CB1190) TaxID=675635 RepID=F4D0Z8_PSEUX|nr:squalene--hopene cyclase [Pseudonocardia dioxanivorans]AEA25850.1 squalene-hopene cyclase [Pseudonocardia dioxanivorans CB1190]GJF06390.1 squalene-hopene cyclase [Pseudonocardia sp. D17]
MTLTAPELLATRTPRAALDAAVAFLRAGRHPDGWWQGELETNVTMDAEDLLLREFLGIRTETETAEAARWIRSRQRADGTWATFQDGPPDLSTTVEAWVALRLAGDDPAAEHMRRAQHHVLAHGGLERTRVFTRIWLALFGLWSWDELPDMPPELIFLPKWFPLNVYDWACWARQTVVPLTVVATLRPSRPLPFGVDELRTGAVPPPPARPWTWAGAFQRLDRVLHAYSRRPLRGLRRLAMRRAAEWVLARQEADGSWGGIQPPWVYSLLALHLLGYPLDHPAVAAGLRGLDRFLVREDTPDGVVRRLEACQSPVWDTCLAVTALLDAGVPADDPDVLAAADWLLAEEVRDVRGDWAVRRPDIPTGGWAFEFDNDGYPDTDDSAEVVLALRRVAHPDPARLRAAVDRGVAWTVGMQSSDGGWGAFDADNTRELITKLPFCDFGAVIDPPSADVTAHVVEMMAAEGLAGTDACRRGVDWLLAAQEPDGSWFGRWGANHVYGTGGVVPALVAAGVSPTAPSIRRAVAWLERHQNDDGGWGEDLRSYDDPAWIGKGASTPSQTAWALLALLAAGERDSAATARGVRYLVDTQLPDGSWEETLYTGTGFPGAFYIRYHLYRMVFPVSALGRYVHGEGTR